MQAGRTDKRGSVSSALFPHTVLSYQNAAGVCYTPAAQGERGLATSAGPAHPCRLAGRLRTPLFRRTLLAQNTWLSADNPTWPAGAVPSIPFEPPLPAAPPLTRVQLFGVMVGIWPTKATHTDGPPGPPAPLPADPPLPPFLPPAPAPAEPPPLDPPALNEPPRPPVPPLPPRPPAPPLPVES